MFFTKQLRCRCGLRSSPESAPWRPRPRSSPAIETLFHILINKHIASNTSTLLQDGLTVCLQGDLFFTNLHYARSLDQEPLCVAADIKSSCSESARNATTTGPVPWKMIQDHHKISKNIKSIKSVFLNILTSQAKFKEVRSLPVQRRSVYWLFASFLLQLFTFLKTWAFLALVWILQLPYPSLGHNEAPQLPVVSNPGSRRLHFLIAMKSQSFQVKLLHFGFANHSKASQLSLEHHQCSRRWCLEDPFLAIQRHKDLQGLRKIAQHNPVCVALCSTSKAIHEKAECQNPHCVLPVHMKCQEQDQRKKQQLVVQLLLEVACGPSEFLVALHLPTRLPEVTSRSEDEELVCL